MSKPYGIIYKATNIVNGKCYIGQTVEPILKNRINGHYYDMNRDNCYFHNALKKYGKDNFKWDVICECETKPMLDVMETFKIMVCGSYRSQNGYNCTWGGEGQSFGFRHTNETKKKISDKNRGRCGQVVTDETKQKLREINLGKVLSEETRKKISVAKLGVLKSDETKHRMSVSKRGIQMSNETKQKLREKHLGKTLSEDHKRKIGEGQIGRVLSDETKKKIGEKNKINSRRYSDDIINEAKEYRRKSMSYGKISKVMNIPQGTIVNWCKNI